MLSIFGAIFSGIGAVVKGIFGLKTEQANIVQQAIKAASDVNNSEAQREMAQAQILVSEMNSGSWLGRNWRPLLMMVFCGIIISFWFGYVPPHLNAPMSPMMMEIFELIKIGMGGYIGGRSIEKIFNTLNLGKVLKAFIEKKVL